MEDSYSILARHYDSLMADIDYASYAGFYEKIIERKVNLFKVIASNKTGILTPEPNISFEIYLNDCNLNHNGYICAEMT